MKKAGHIARDQLLAFGTCFGKFTKTSKFRLHITALDFLAPYAKVVDVMLVFIASATYCTVCWTDRQTDCPVTTLHT